MFNKYHLVLIIGVLLFTFQVVYVQAAQRALGVNIRTSDGTVYTITSENNRTARRPYTSAGAFLSFSFNTWQSVIEASAEDLSLPVGSFIPPQDGKIFCSDRGNDKGTCYLITGSKKAGFVDADVFTGLGYNFRYATSGDVSFLMSTSNINTADSAHQSGTLIDKDGTVFLVTKNGLLGLPSWDTLTSWGYLESDIVPANDADRNLQVKGVVTPKRPEQISPPIEMVPTLSYLFPDYGSAGITFTLYGTDLGWIGHESATVRFGSTAAQYYLGSIPNIFNVIVPGLAPGVYPVTVQIGAHVTRAFNFTVFP